MPDLTGSDRRAIFLAESKYWNAFGTALANRLQAGEHLMLYGPRGSGKTTLTESIYSSLKARSIPCAISANTRGLSDVVTALARAYPQASLIGLDRRAMRARLRYVADSLPGVLLLDHIRDVTTAMIGFFRRLRGGVAGILIIVDSDAEFERNRLVGWRRHATRVQMPLMPPGELEKLLESAWLARGLPQTEGKIKRRIVRAARGRIGWLRECTPKLEEVKYWREGVLRVGALCTDIEVIVRVTRQGPRARYRLRSEPNAR
jgi:energy-coupling factor transporter ATP-binding protein EcfA2